MNSNNVRQTGCCISGGGPAGVMLGYILARAGVDVTILEKHADFFRDFRGDTIHPSTLEIIDELGLLERFLKVPHEELSQFKARFFGAEFTVADFSHLPTRCKFIAFMPQWDFLNFLAEEGRKYSTFHLLMGHAATGLLRDASSRAVTGVSVSTPSGPLEIRADLVVVAEGRHSTLRAQSGVHLEDYGAPMDVLWMRISRRPEDPVQPTGNFAAGRIFVMLNRNDYWQCGLVIPKGGADVIKAAGLQQLQQNIRETVPYLGDRVKELQSWEQIKLLVVQVNRLERWYEPGCLFIGDAAHAMSPIGGVGINLAIQDAVAAANALARPLKTKTVTLGTLRGIQRRREFPTRLTQRVQRELQDTIFKQVLSGADQPQLPLAMRAIQKFPTLSRIPARLIGLGIRREHVTALGH